MMYDVGVGLFKRGGRLILLQVLQGYHLYIYSKNDFTVKGTLMQIWKSAYRNYPNLVRTKK